MTDNRVGGDFAAANRYLSISVQKKQILSVLTVKENDGLAVLKRPFGMNRTHGIARSTRLLDGVGAVAFFLEFFHELAHFLRAFEIADQQRVGSIDDDCILDA